MPYTGGGNTGTACVKVIGLTGGIATGKTTAARALRRAHLPVFDADAVVRRLQSPGGAALPAIAQAFPGTVRADPDGVRRLDRAALRRVALADPAALRRLEAIMHPLVHAGERAFLAAARRRRARAVVLDIPLLVETGRLARRGRGGIDAVIVTSAPSGVQRSRALRRGTLTAAQLTAILERQLPEAQRRRSASKTVKTRVVHTGLSRHHGNVQLLRTLRELLR